MQPGRLRCSSIRVSGELCMLCSCVRVRACDFGSRIGTLTSQYSFSKEGLYMCDILKILKSFFFLKFLLQNIFYSD